MCLSLSKIDNERKWDHVFLVPWPELWHMAEHHASKSMSPSLPLHLFGSQKPVAKGCQMRQIKI